MKNTTLLNFFLFFFGLATAFGQKETKLFTEFFNQEGCTFLTSGRNTYFVLEPNFQLTLFGMEGKDSLKLVVTVLNETKKIGNIETRIVEEHESKNGEVVEISRNYFAICKETGTVFYFGENVDIYKNGQIISHSGSWIAEGNNKAGIVMPGQLLIGSRYYQEIAPQIAMDRGEIISISESITTSAGTFNNVLKIEETTPLDPKERAYKFYAPGIGLIKDGALLLIKYGTIK